MLTDFLTSRFGRCCDERGYECLGTAQGAIIAHNRSVDYLSSHVLGPMTAAFARLGFAPIGGKTTPTPTVPKVSSAVLQWNRWALRPISTAQR